MLVRYIEDECYEILASYCSMYHQSDTTLSIQMCLVGTLLHCSLSTMMSSTHGDSSSKDVNLYLAVILEYKVCLT